MQMDTGIIKVVRIDVDGNRSAAIELDESLKPSPGKYLLAHNPQEREQTLARVLFPTGLQNSFNKSFSPQLGPIPMSWIPGTSLLLRGPLGRGFDVPSDVRRLVLVSLGNTLARLLPLVNPALHSGADVVIFARDQFMLDTLPASVEIQPIDNLPETLDWATLLILEVPLAELSSLREIFHLDSHDRLPCPAQALVWTSMPCGGLADCGACAVPIRKRSRYKLACKDGPVFDLHELDW